MVYISADGSVGGKKSTWKWISEFMNSKWMSLFAVKDSLYVYYVPKYCRKKDGGLRSLPSFFVSLPYVSFRFLSTKID
jgi:hypothetical protein